MESGKAGALCFILLITSLLFILPFISLYKENVHSVDAAIPSCPNLTGLNLVMREVEVNRHSYSIIYKVKY